MHFDSNGTNRQLGEAAVGGVRLTALLVSSSRHIPMLTRAAGIEVDDTADRDSVRSREDLAHRPPPHELCWAFDDDANPSSVTLYSDTEPAIFTNWITIDVEHALEAPTYR